MTQKIVKFTSKDYFESKKESSKYKKLPYILLTSKGIELVSNYYKYKYELPTYRTVQSTSELASVIKSDDFKTVMKNTKEEIRLLFRLKSGDADNPHSTPIIYLKDYKDGRERHAVFYFDSIGLPANYLASQLGKKITVFEVKDWDLPREEKHYKSQRDFYSCHVGTLVYFREMAAKENGKYRMPSLLDTVQAKVTKTSGNLCEVTLPENLLITVQDKTFLRIQKASLTTIVHKKDNNPETLGDFFKRYPEKKNFDASKKKYVSAYAREKGFKYAKIIEIQFYIEQLQKNLGERFTAEIHSQFIFDAKIKNKAIFNNSIYKLAEKYLKDYSKKPSKYSLFSHKPWKKGEQYDSEKMEDIVIENTSYRAK